MEKFDEMTKANKIQMAMRRDLVGKILLKDRSSDSLVKVIVTR
jgi:hypothetical protein